MGTFSTLIDERTDLTHAERDRLFAITAEWSLLADLAMSDLVLWLPTWNDGGMVAGALVRPTTAPTNVPDDVVGTFAPRGREPELDAALAFGRPQGDAFPVHFGARVIAVVARHSSPQPRVAGQLERVYARSADDLLDMLVAGTFPATDPDAAPADAPRVGDGLIRCSTEGLVEYASPNAMSALRRLGAATNIEGRELRSLATRLVHRPGPVDDAVNRILAGREAGTIELENRVGTVQVRGLPLWRAGESVGTLVLLRDVTEVRRRERALVSKDATIKEIHHRVKNNLQMVAALLRLQSRRVTSDEARVALDEAQLRVAAIAVVHEALSKDIADTVAFDEVLDRILAGLVELAPAYSDDGRVPTFERRGTALLLPSALATPLAMCISELVQNAIEHAAAAHVVIEISQGEDGIVAAVRDDGVGLPPGFTLDDAGLGLQIVQTMATGELAGAFEISGDEPRGTIASVRVPS